MAFESLSHGTIVFGFVNIESDMLLLGRYFLFAENFCGYIKNMAKNAGDGHYHIRWEIQFIEAVEIGVYRFNRVQFQELIKYVWRGGYPRWKDEIRPGYVTGMRDNILQNRTGIFDGIVLTD